VTVGKTQRSDTQALQLPPRITQPARLQFRLVANTDSADPEEVEAGSTANPVCGWLLANHLDDALMVFNADGNSLGSVVLTGGGPADLDWQPAVGVTPEIAAPSGIQNAPLRQVILGLFNRSDRGAAFIDWMAAIDSTLWTTEPLGRRGDNLSVLIGRPLAVVRASLGIELQESAATSQLWEDTGRQVTRGFAAVPFDVQLGHLDLRGDGTLGYFGPDAAGTTTYDRFFAVQSKLDLSQRPTNEQKYIQRGTVLAKIGRRVFVTLLVDPRGSVHARTGILPAKSISLPARFVKVPLERMDVTFRVGPLLNEPTGLRMPLPVNVAGSWSWIAKTGVSFAPPDKNITPATSDARLADTPIEIHEGWLKLSDAVG
jgi:hypothetical protein